MKYILLSTVLFLSSCCDNCCSVTPPLRPLPNCTTPDQPTGIRIPCKVFRCK